MKLLLTLLGLFLTTSTVFAGGGSGSGGVSRGDLMIQTAGDYLEATRANMSGSPQDYIRTLGHDSAGNIKFQYKPYDNNAIQTHKLNENEIAEKFIEAIKNSEISHKWEAVQVN